MTIDARAYVWCNLGPLSEEGASIAEDHAQGAGVLMLKGTVNLNGIFRPTSGAVVKLAYSDGQTWIAQFPLRLRVLSCFSDPIRNKTTVSVGCDLAYYENRKEPVTLDERDENTNVPEAQRRAQTPAISGAWLVGMILCILRIRYDGTIPLTNYYTRQDYDMSGGYVEELGKLCASEGYVCRMNEAGRAEFISKDQPITGGALLTQDDLIDFNPINSGDLPGDAAYAKYTSIKLKKPDENEDEDERKKRDWEMEETYGQRETYYHDWNRYTYQPTGQTKKVKDERCITVGASTYPSDSLPEGATANANGDLEKPAYETKSFPQREEITYVPYTKTVSEYDSKDRVVFRWSEKHDHFGIQRTETRFTYKDDDTTTLQSGSGSSGTWDAFVCTYQSSEDDGSDTPVDLAPAVKAKKDDNAGQIVKEVTIEFSPIGPVRMNLGLERKFSDAKGSGIQYVSSRRVVEYDRNQDSGITKTITRNYVPFVQTQDGSEVISKIRNRREPWEDVPVNGSLVNMATKLVESGSEVRIRTEREFGIQKRPSAAQRTTEANAKTPPDVEEEARIAWAVGSAASQTAVELSPPYAPDDRVVGSGSTYFVIPSDAPQKVLQYARLENRYLFGHRNGAGIQVLPEALPPKPLSVVYIRLKGCTGAFLVNGRTWNLDPNGATVTCDALFWAAIDGTVADAWFPLPPNIAALPTPVAITTNSNPVPANAIPIPSGFNFSNPDLNALFGALPANQAPIPPATIAPAIIVKPYRETIFCGAGSGSGAIADPQFWIAQPPGEYTAGSGSGVLATAVAGPSTSLGARWTSGTTFTAAAGTAGPGHGGGERWVSGSVFVAGVGSDGMVRAPGARWTSATAFTAGAAEDGLELGAGARWTSGSTFTAGAGSDDLEQAPGAAWASASVFVAGAGDDGIEQGAGAAWSSGSTFTAGAGNSGLVQGAGANWASGSVFYAGVGGVGDGSGAGAAWASGSTFTAGAGSAAETDPYFSSVSLLLPFNGTNGSTTFTDQSLSARTPTSVVNTSITTAQSRFGGSSAAFGGNGYIAYAPAAGLQFDGDFTLEGWFYMNSYQDMIFGSSSSDQNTQVFRFNQSSNGTIAFYLNGTQVIHPFAAGMQIETWYHVALTRAGASTRAFINGIQQGSTEAYSGAFRIDFLGALNFSSGQQYLHYFNGNANQFRVTKGIARYTANFTPPTAPFPNS